MPSPQQKHEDTVLADVLRTTLNQAAEAVSVDPPCLFQGSLAQELASEGAGGDPDAGAPLLSREILDRVVMSRLLDPPASYPQPPVQYLLGCYERASQQLRQAGLLKDKTFSARLQEALSEVKDLAVRYTSLLLTMEDSMFEQPAAAKKMGPLQLGQSLDAAAGKPLPGVVAIPNGFLEDFAAHTEPEGLDTVFQPIAAKLAAQLLGVSIAGDIQHTLSHWLRLTAIKPIAAAITRHPMWLTPYPTSGRTLQYRSLLGPLFCLNVISDAMADVYSKDAQPSIVQQEFSDLENRSQSELMRSMDSLRLLQGQIHTSLHSIVMNFLRTPDAKEPMIKWLTVAVESCSGRIKMGRSIRQTPTDGFTLTLNAVLLKLCDPFVDPSSNKAWSKLDLRYLDSGRANLKDETKLSMDEEEYRAWQQRTTSEQSASTSSSPPQFHFICDCFFLTMKSLHLGYCNLVQMLGEPTSRAISRMRSKIKELELQVEQAADTPQQAYIEAELKETKRIKDRYTGGIQTAKTCVSDPALVAAVMRFYRLAACWLLRVASPKAAQGGPPDYPLPQPPSGSFRVLPELIVEDLAEVMEWAGAHQMRTGDTMDKRMLEDLYTFLLVLMGSRDYIRNPYLHSKMSKGLINWVPGQLLQPDLNPPGLGRQRIPDTPLTTICEGHPDLQQYMVPSFMEVFMCVERTSRHNQFYEKFTARYGIGMMLTYLWTIPAQRAAWEKLAAEEGGQGRYRDFCSLLVNDINFLMDAAVEHLKEARKLEGKKEDQAAWDALGQEEQAEATGNLEQALGIASGDLAYASVNIGLLNFSSESITATWLLPEMIERVASMLNYFLGILTGPQRRMLRVKDMEKIRWRPKEVLVTICGIFLNLAKADPDERFPRAIVADSRSYSPDLFPAACQVLRNQMLLMEPEIGALEQLAQRCSAAVAEGEADDAAFEDPPEEFVDPLMDTLMTDPVKLPTNFICDRPVIVRHLLSDKTCPFTRAPMQIEDLQPLPDLQAKIQAWMKEQREARKMQS